MRSIRVPVATLLTLSLSLPLTVAVPGVAHAQVPPPPAAAAPEPAPQAAPAQELSEEEKIERAKNLYIEAEGLFADGRYAEAVPLYEEAYYLVPGKHGFAHKVGVAAFKAGDCNKANDYLKHFLTYGDEEKHGDKVAEAKQILGEISVSGCATDSNTTTTSTGGGGTTAKAEDAENPLGESSTEVRQTEAKKAREAKKNEKRGLLIGGAVLTGIGVAGVATGIAGLGIANSSANSLRELSSNATLTGFPVGDYSCRNVSADQCPHELESRMKTGNVLGYVGLGLGGAALAGGVAMLAIYMINKKKSGGSVEQAPTEGEAGVELSELGPMLLPGGGAGATVGFRF